MFNEMGSLRDGLMGKHNDARHVDIVYTTYRSYNKEKGLPGDGVKLCRELEQTRLVATAWRLSGFARLVPHVFAANSNKR